MNTYHLKVSTPDGAQFEGDAAALIVRAAEGDLAVLAHHMPLMTTVRAGDIRIQLPDGREKTARTDGGLLTVGQEETVLLLSSLTWAEQS